MKKTAVILPPERKRTVPSNAFKKGEPNPHAFRPGQSGNLGGMGRPRDPYRLVSRALRHRLNVRATDEAALEAGLEPGASWSQVIAAALINMAASGNVQAIREIREFTEGSRAKLELIGADGEPLTPPALNVLIVPSGSAAPDRPTPARQLPEARQPSAEMLDSDSVARAATAIVLAVAAGKPRTTATINSCLPSGWVFDANPDDDLQQPTAAAHWELLLRARVVPRR